MPFEETSQSSIGAEGTTVLNGKGESPKDTTDQECQAQNANLAESPKDLAEVKDIIDTNETSNEEGELVHGLQKSNQVPDSEALLAVDSQHESGKHTSQPEPKSQSRDIQECQEPDILESILREAESKEIQSSASNSSSDEDTGSESNDESDRASSSEDEAQDHEDDISGNSDGEEDETSGQPIVSKNEVVDELAPSLPDDFKIDLSEPIEEIGTVTGIVDRSIIIKGNLSGEFRFLKEGSVLCFEDRTPLGYLFEIFGPLAHPLYRVKYNTDDDLEKLSDPKDKKVFYVVPKSNFEYTDSIKVIKGSDASNWNDEEVPEGEQEFSDDEKEMESKKSKNKKKRNRKNKDFKSHEDQSLRKSQPNRKFEHKHQKIHNLQENNLYRNQQQTSSSSAFGYQSRSQREQNAPSNLFTSQQYPIPMFQPPPQMVSPSFPPVQANSAPVAGFTPTMNPQQWQQFYQMQQMQQMMFQQMYATQQHLQSQQQLPQQGLQNQSEQPQPQNQELHHEEHESISKSTNINE